MSDTAPGPFARFPCLAALFSAACVGTGTWLWLRYSYAWHLTPREMSAVRWKFNHDDPWRSHHPLVGRYVRLVGIPGDIWMGSEGSSYLLVHDRSDEGYAVRVCMPEGGSWAQPCEWEVCRGRTDGSPRLEAVCGGSRCLLFGCRSGARSFRKAAAESFVGRPVLRDECCGCGGDLFVALDCAAGRFTRESVVGLFVGGIGLLVLALHLGWWLVDRRASTLGLSYPVAPERPSGDDTG